MESAGQRGGVCERGECRQQMYVVFMYDLAFSPRFEVRYYFYYMHVILSSIVFAAKAIEGTERKHFAMSAHRYVGTPAALIVNSLYFVDNQR